MLIFLTTARYSKRTMSYRYQAFLCPQNGLFLCWSSPHAPNTGTGERNDLKRRCVNMKQLNIAMLCSFRWNSKAATRMNILLYEEEAIKP